MRDDVQDEIAAAMETAEEAFETPAVAPEAIMAEHFLDVFKRGAEVTLAKIAKFKADYAGLTIAGVEDKKGYEMVRTARIHVKQHRTAVERVRKAENEEHQAQIKRNNAAAKHLEALLEEIEEPLEAEEKRYDAQVKAIKEAAQREKEAKLQRRIDALSAVGHPVNVGELVTMPDTTFAMVLATATEAFEAREKIRLEAEAALAAQQEAARLEAERKAKEEAEAKAAEAKRLAEERAALDAQRKEQEAQAAALKAKQDEMDRKEREAAQRERDAQIRQDAEAKAKAEAERKAKEEAERQERDRLDADAKRKAQEAARPDAEKILALAESVRGTAFPNMVSPDGQKVMVEIKDCVARLAKFIEAKGNGITSAVFG